jgi:hypothetical protein
MKSACAIKFGKGPTSVGPLKLEEKRASAPEVLSCGTDTPFGKLRAGPVRRF